MIIPPTLSGGAHDFMSSFAYTGTRDYTSFCATGVGLDFRASLGTEAEVIGLIGHAYWSIMLTVCCGCMLCLCAVTACYVCVLTVC